jgi:hypothetical protein
MVKLSVILAVFLFASVAEAQIVTCVPTYAKGCVLTLSWQNNPAPDGAYLGLHVWRKLNTTTYPTTPFATLGPNITSVVDTTLAQSPTVANNYTYVVTAFNSSVVGINQESQVSNEVAYTVPVLPVINVPIAPSNARLQ